MEKNLTLARRELVSNAVNFPRMTALPQCTANSCPHPRRYMSQLPYDQNNDGESSRTGWHRCFVTQPQLV